MHYTLNIELIPIVIHQLTVKFFAHCPSHPNPLVQQIGNCTVADFTNIQEIYTRIIYFYNWLSESRSVFFYFNNFSLPLFTLIYIHFCFICVIV